MAGIVWGFYGDSMDESQIQIVRYFDENSKNKAIKALELHGYWEINSASDDDLNVDYGALISDENFSGKTYKEMQNISMEKDGDKNLAKQEEPLKYIDTWPYD